jgi:hypothetical protein
MLSFDTSLVFVVVDTFSIADFAMEMEVSFLLNNGYYLTPEPESAPT